MIENDRKLSKMIENDRKLTKKWSKTIENSQNDEF